MKEHMLTDRRLLPVVVPLVDGTTKACVRSNTKVREAEVEKPKYREMRTSKAGDMRNVKAPKPSWWLLLPIVIYLPI